MRISCAKYARQKYSEYARYGTVACTIISNSTTTTNHHHHHHSSTYGLPIINMIKLKNK